MSARATVVGTHSFGQSNKLRKLPNLSYVRLSTASRTFLLLTLVTQEVANLY